MFVVAMCILFAAPTPEALVGAYADTIRFYDSTEMKLRYWELCESPTRLRGVTVREGTYVVRHEGTHWWIEQKGLQRTLDADGRIAEAPTCYEFVMNGEIGQLLITSEGTEAKLQHITGDLKPPPEAKSVGTVDYFMMLLGFIYGNGTRSFVDVLLDAERYGSEDTIDGEMVLRLDSRGRYGRVKIWFDPVRGMQMRRMVISRGSDDLLNDRKVSSIPVIAPDNLFPGGKIVRFETLIDVRKFGKWGNRYFPQDVMIKRTTFYQGGQQGGIRYTFHVDSFKQGGLTTSDFQVRTPIPDGFPVQLNDDPKIEYEWRDGRVVKAISAEARANLLTERFGSSFSLVGYFVGFAVLLLSTTVLAVWLYRRAGAYR